MSETATRISPQAELGKWARQLAFMFTSDLKHMPEISFTESIGGKARNVNSIASEIVGFCALGTAVVRGAEVPKMEESLSADPNLVTADACVEAVHGAIDELASAIEAATDDSLTEMVTAPWGQPMSRFEFAQIVVNHVWYHDGQLNLIQAFHGDEQVHWMGD